MTLRIPDSSEGGVFDNDHKNKPGEGPFLKSYQSSSMVPKKIVDISFDSSREEIVDTSNRDEVKKGGGFGGGFSIRV